MAAAAETLAVGDENIEATVTVEEELAVVAALMSEGTWQQL